MQSIVFIFLVIGLGFRFLNSITHLSDVESTPFLGISWKQNPILSPILFRDINYKKVNVFLEWAKYKQHLSSMKFGGIMMVVVVNAQ